VSECRVVLSASAFVSECISLYIADRDRKRDRL